MKDITSNGGKWVHLTICKTRTVSIPLAFSNDTSSFWTTFPGGKADKMDKWLPLSNMRMC